MNTEQTNLVHLFPQFYIQKKFGEHDTYKDAIFNKSFSDENLEDLPTLQKHDLAPFNTYPCVTEEDENLDLDVFPSFMQDLEAEIALMMIQCNIQASASVTNIWYNIYGHGDSHERHTHIGHPVQLSGVYFYDNVRTDEFALWNPCIKLLEGSGYNHPIWRESDLNFAHDIAIPVVEEGTILLFPPYLEHAVRPIKNDLDKKRITFAFNLAFKPETQTPPAPPEENQIQSVVRLS